VILITKRIDKRLTNFIFYETFTKPKSQIYWFINRSIADLVKASPFPWRFVECFVRGFFPLFYLHAVVWIRFIFNTKTPLSWIISHTNILGILCAKVNCKKKKNRIEQIFFPVISILKTTTLLLREVKKNLNELIICFSSTPPRPVSRRYHSLESPVNGNSIWIVLSIISFRSYLDGHSITLYAHLYTGQQIESVSILAEALCYTSNGVTVNI